MMFKFVRIFLRHYRQIAVVASLGLSTALCLALWVVRVAHSHGFGYTGFVWNLFLAWLPMLCALLAYNAYKRHSWFSWLVVAGCAVVWLLFFPNAPYLVTDIIHLNPRPEAPFWYDLILVSAFAWTGLFLGLVSLFLMQELVRKAMSTFPSWVFTAGVWGVTGIGVYLGRFLRWNSWDVFFNPISILADVWDRVRHPLAHWQTFVFSLLFSCFFIAAYLMLVALTHLPREIHRPSESADANR